MIHYIGRSPNNVCVSLFTDFMDWANDQPEVQFDVETTVSEYWCRRYIITLQFGDINNSVQWVLQWSYLDREQKAFVKWVLEGKKTKLIHNAQFECVVCLFHGIRVQNVYDTMLMEMVLNCGVLNYSGEEDDEQEALAEPGFYSLIGLTSRYLFVLFDKDLQKEFGDDIITVEKIVYAATDVKYLGFIRRHQQLLLHLHDLEYVAALENEVVLVFSQMTYEGMEMNIDKWLENIELAQPVVDEARKELEAAIKADPKLKTGAVRLGYLSDEDRVEINWNSPPQKQEIFDHFFPELPGTAIAVLGKWYRDNPNCSQLLKVVCSGVLKKDYTNIQRYITETGRPWLVEQGFIIPAGESTINWNAWQQTLPLFQCVCPGLESTNKKVLERKLKHTIKVHYNNYQESRKLLSTYGIGFFSNLEPDGKVRTVFKQVVSTGRVSASPNLQNIPVGKKVGLRYRNAFICDKGWKYVGADYKQQELVIMAIMSEEPVWLDVIRKEQDLHGVCAEIVHQDKWRKVAEPGCIYMNGRMKCKCKKHISMRELIKTVNFGIPYGMSHFKLSVDGNMTVPEAKTFLAGYGKLFPWLDRLLKTLESFGVNNGFIMTLAPFFRKRWFPAWEEARNNIGHHEAGIIHDKALGSIGRQSKNMPIQGSGADITKTALCVANWYIWDTGVQDKVKFKMQVHDSIDTVAVDEYAEEWAPQLQRLMEEAALLVIPSGLLKAETTITDVWSK